VITSCKSFPSSKQSAEKAGAELEDISRRREAALNTWGLCGRIEDRALIQSDKRNGLRIMSEGNTQRICR
jgi:hypothetical protein